MPTFTTDILKPNGFVVDFKKNKLVCQDDSIEIRTLNSIKEKTLYAVDEGSGKLST